MKNYLKNISDMLLPAKSILITSHRDPDGDSIGSQLALAELLESRGKSSYIINQGELPSKYRFLDPQKRIQNLNSIPEMQNSKTPFDLVFVLDSTCLERIGEVGKLITPGAAMINIDHHPDNERFGTFNYIDEKASAVGEMVFALLKYFSFPLTAPVAAQLYTAILTDTGRFKFSNTTPLCLKTCAELVEAGADPRYITNQIYFNHSLPFLKLLGSVLSHPQILFGGKVCAMIIRQESLAELGVEPNEMEGVVNYTLFLKGVEVGLLFTEKENGKTKVNLRSKNEYDVSKVARIFGGGGHRNAAGCTLDLALKEAQQIIVERIGRMLKNEPVGSISS
jgi:phosphoesterase RecJ-like protein